MTAAAGQRIFFQQCFGVSVSNGWIKAFQRTRGQPHFFQVCCMGGWFWFVVLFSKLHHWKTSLKGDRLDCLPLGPFRTTGKNCVPLPMLWIVSAMYDQLLSRQSLGYRHFWLLHCPEILPPRSWLCMAPIWWQPTELVIPRVRILGGSTQLTIGPLSACGPTLQRIQWPLLMERLTLRPQLQDSN